MPIFFNFEDYPKLKGYLTLLWSRSEDDSSNFSLGPIICFNKYSYLKSDELNNYFLIKLR